MPRNVWRYQLLASPLFIGSFLFLSFSCQEEIKSFSHLRQDLRRRPKWREPGSLMVFSRSSKGSSTGGNKRRPSTTLAAKTALNWFTHCHLFLYAIGFTSEALGCHSNSLFLISVVVFVSFKLEMQRIEQLRLLMSYRRKTQQPNSKWKYF